MKHIFSLIRRTVLDGLFPAFCLGCRVEGTFLCASCVGGLVRLEAQICPWCYGRSQLGAVCRKCIGEGRFLDGVLASAKFEEKGLLQRVIHNFKYDFLEDLREPLGKFLVETFLPLVRRFPEKKFVLSPLPLHLRRKKWRGFNQAELLCEILMRELRAMSVLNVEVRFLLERISFSKAQMELDREARLTNVQGAFRILEPVAGEVVVLVDDIATTLSTLNSAASALKKAGAAEVYGLVLARVF